MSLDQFYTPPDTCAVAYRSWKPVNEEMAIGDFACGNGSLLELAPFPNKIVYGLDIDPGVISALRSRYPEWHLCSGNFLNPCPQANRFLQELVGGLDMIVLNPPFSCRGGTKEYVRLNGKEVGCSKSLAFVLNSMPFLKEGGSLMAILPKSVLRSEKDAEAIEHIRRNWRIDVEAEFCRKTFEGCYPQSVCVNIQRIGVTAKTIESRNIVRSAPKIIIVRGSTPMHLTSEAGQYKVLHTTALRVADPIGAITRYSSRPGRSVEGTFITIPRVGAPDIKKIRLLQAIEDVTLSDCVLALVPEDPLLASHLLGQIQSSWELLEDEYGSTCAPYITIAQVTSFLSKCGWEAANARDIPSS